MENHTVYAKSADVQVTAKLTIKDFIEVMKTSKPGKFYSSDTFMVGDTPMAIHVYPNGQEDKYKGIVSVFLWNEGDADVSVKWQMITDAKTISFDHEVRAQNSWGRFEFLSHAECTDVFKVGVFDISISHIEYRYMDTF